MQKTIAKWLVILLLCTVSVGSFLLYDALKDSGSAVGADQTDTYDDKEDDKNPEEPYIPTYSTLPREAKDFGAVKASHVGGGKDEIFLSAVNIQEKSFIFFSTESTDGDLRSTGLAVAYFESGSLISATTYSKSGTFCDCKLTTSGIAVTTNDDSGGKLYLFSTDGTLKAEKDLDTFKSGKLFLLNKSLFWFYTDGTRLYASQILADASIQKSAFLFENAMLSKAGTIIKQAFSTSDKITVIIQADDGTLGVDYKTGTGFSPAFYLDKLSFNQILTVSGESGTSFIVSSNDGSVPVLTAFETNWNIIGSKRVDGCSSGIAFSKGDSLVFYGNGTTLKTCRHLDVIQKKSNLAGFDTVLVFGGYDGYSLVEEGGAISLIETDTDAGKHSAIYSLTSSSGNVMWARYTEKINLMFSSSGRDGYLGENFGGSDVFSLTFDIDN